MGLFATVYGAVTATLLVSFWLSTGHARRRLRMQVPSQRSSSHERPRKIRRPRLRRVQR